jgi:uncharacterized protein
MLYEYTDIISHMKTTQAANAHFLKIFDKHSELESRLGDAEKGNIPLTKQEMENLKKEKLKLKDKAYGMIINYKKAQGL